MCGANLFSSTVYLMGADAYFEFSGEKKVHFWVTYYEIRHQVLLVYRRWTM